MLKSKLLVVIALVIIPAFILSACDDGTDNLIPADRTLDTFYERWCVDNVRYNEQATACAEIEQARILQGILDELRSR